MVLYNRYRIRVKPANDVTPDCCIYFAKYSFDLQDKGFYLVQN